MVVRFINEIVLEEECDRNAPGSPGPEFISHFDLYRRAMVEVGADPGAVVRFVHLAAAQGIDAALEAGIARAPSATFTRKTFSFIETGEPHIVAAALAYGREKIIPSMFRAFLVDMKITSEDAPVFHYYLNRHIHLDEDFHGPLSSRMVGSLCEGSAVRFREAEDAAIEAITARIAFWDGVHAALS